MKPRYPFTPDDKANALLAGSGTAFLIGMCLDQQVRTEKAFSGPYVLRERTGTIDARRIARMRPATLAAAFRERPAIHRFPGSMAKRVQQLCRMIVERYAGDGARVWAGVRTAPELAARLRELPGFGEAKAACAVRILGKFGGAKIRGWRAFAHESDLPWTYRNGVRG